MAMAMMMINNIIITDRVSKLEAKLENTVEKYRRKIEALAREAKDAARATSSAVGVGIQNEGGSFVSKQHGVEMNHGDVCRDSSGQLHCPKGCFLQLSPDASWCVMNQTKTAPCRFSRRLASKR
jgi:hypothetical protein